MEELKIEKLLNLEETIAKDVFKGCTYPWEAISKIGDFIKDLIPKLDKEVFEERFPNVWVAKSATIAPSACIIGPCIIDENAQVLHSAYIRENVIVGKNAVVGNSTELKNVILFNEAKVPHFNYAGDSILGYKSHIGASGIISNLKSDKSQVTINYNNEKIETGLKKFGAILGDFVEMGCGSVLNPGTIIGRNTNVYALSSVRGVVKEKSIYKNKNEIVEKYKKQE